MRYQKRTKADMRAQWMQDYEHLVVSSRPEQAGRIDWDTATFFYNSGYSPEMASAKTIARIVGD